MVPRYSDNARSNGDSCGGSNAVVGITDQLGLDEEGSHENEFIVKKEIAEWLSSLDYDSIWASRTRKRWEVSHGLSSSLYKFLMSTELPFC